MDIPGSTLPKNFLRPCLLLLLAEEPAHGYDLLVRLQELGVARNDPGGLYRALRALEQEGLVQSWWEDSGAGPARRVYQPTDEGRDWLHVWAVGLEDTRALLETFLTRYVSVTGRASRGRA